MPIIFKFHIVIGIYKFRPLCACTFAGDINVNSFRKIYRIQMIYAQTVQYLSVIYYPKWAIEPRDKYFFHYPSFQQDFNLLRANRIGRRLKWPLLSGARTL